MKVQSVFQMSTSIFFLTSIFFIVCEASLITVQQEYKNYLGNIILLSFSTFVCLSLLSADFWKMNLAMRYYNTQMYGVNGGHLLL